MVRRMSSPGSKIKSPRPATIYGQPVCVGPDETIDFVDEPHIDPQDQLRAIVEELETGEYARRYALTPVYGVPDVERSQLTAGTPAVPDGTSSALHPTLRVEMDGPRSMIRIDADALRRVQIASELARHPARRVYVPSASRASRRIDSVRAGSADPEISDSIAGRPRRRAHLRPTHQGRRTQPARPLHRARRRAPDARRRRRTHPRRSQRRAQPNRPRVRAYRRLAA